MTETKPKRHIKELTLEFRAFWEGIFEDVSETAPPFFAKLCYLGKEFSTDGSRTDCVRFFPSELSLGVDMYVELFNWDQDHYEEGHRVLYKLPYDPDWKSKPGIYKEITTNSQGDKLPNSTYAIMTSQLELVNRTSKKFLEPQITKLQVNRIINDAISSVDNEPGKDPFDEEPFNEMYSEKEDAHYTSMTIRDIYCMLQNVPLSNKKWLNQLIDKGKSCQK